jgi:proteasome accessory factor B
LERLVNLVVAFLDTKKPLTREELRERVPGYGDDGEAFRRNFERDKDLLRALGIPLLVEPLDPAHPDLGTGYRVPKDLYELPDPGLDDEELLALNLAVSAVSFEGDGSSAATSALWKLAASTAPGPPPSIHTDAATGTDRGAGAGLSPPGQRLGGPSGTGASGGRSRAQAPAVVDVAVDETVATFFSGAASRSQLRFQYNGEERLVDPYHLAYRQGRWYLSGFDHVRGAERLFRADRAQGPVELASGPGAFDAPPPTAGAAPPPPWRLGDEPAVEVELRVDASQALFARRALGDDAVHAEEPAGTYFRVTVTNREAFRGFVLGFLEHAEILGPPAVRDEMIAWLSALALPDRAHSAAPAESSGRPPRRGRGASQ